MPLRCPVCKADNAPPTLPSSPGGEGKGGGAQCRRCKADLSLLFALEEQRRVVLDAAQHAASRGEWRDFLSATEQADALRSDDESRRLLATARLLQGDFAGALDTAQRVGERMEQRHE
ncbi:MAG: hypothetical protein HYS12_23815 [Planctomycetes bacterium]|nr:hypothetical protein [Planctomycetota bacterium]